MSKSIVEEKSFKFAVRIVNLYKFLSETKKEYILSKQMLRSGTSVGANINEALEGQSKRDYVAKMSISLKEIRETIYWLRLLKETDYINETEFNSIYTDGIEIKKLLTSIVKTTRQNIAKGDS